MLRSKSRHQEFNEEEFFGFAKSYLSSDLQRMAEDPVPERDDHISKYLTCCSPCFNRYMQILADLKRRSNAENSACLPRDG